MGNSNCGCASKKVGGKRVKRGGMGCNKTKKHKHNKKGGSGCHKKNKTKVRTTKSGGGCGCELMSGGYKYDRRSSVEAVKRLKKRVSKNTKSKSKGKSKGKSKKKHSKSKRRSRK